jgi:hypothetical protein
MTLIELVEFPGSSTLLDSDSRRANFWRRVCSRDVSMAHSARSVDESRQMLDSVATTLHRARQLRDESVLVNRFANAVGRFVRDVLRRQAENPSLNPMAPPQEPSSS